MQPLRIAQVTATFAPYAGGTGNVCLHHARELARRGHTVHVFPPLLPGTAPYEERDGVSIRRLRPWLRSGNASLLPGLLPALRSFDLIHLHYPCMLTAEVARLAAWGYRIPLVVSFHNDLIGDGARARIFTRYQHTSARLTVRGAARLCVLSRDHYEASHLRQELPESQPPIVVLPNGVDVAHFHPGVPDANLRSRHGIPSAARIVLFVAALDRAHHFKGLSILLQAALQLPPDTYLLVVGDGDLRLDYQRQVTQLGLTDRVAFAGAIGQDELPAYYRDAHVTVLPSSPPESFGLVLVESLACGTPVIASDIPGVRTVVDHGRDGFLVQPRDPVALAEAIVRIVADEGVRREMGRRGRAKVEAHYDWRAIGAQLEVIYRRILGQAALSMQPGWYGAR